MTTEQFKQEIQRVHKDKYFPSTYREHEWGKVYIVVDGKEFEPTEYIFDLIDRLDDQRLAGKLEQIYMEWASESGDYKGGLEEILDNL